MQAEFERGDPSAEIAARHGCHVTTVNLMARKRGWQRKNATARVIKAAA